MLTLLIASTCWTGAMAQYYESKDGKGAHVGNLYYLLNRDTHTAIVTNRTMSNIGSDAGSNSYSETIVIPETFDVEQETLDETGTEVVTYTVIGIQGYAFFGCTNLKSVSIPNTVTTIGERAFDESNNLKEITVAPLNANFYQEDGVLYNKLKTELIFCTKTKSDKVVVPDDVERIQEFAFSNCNAITEIVLPDELKEIGEFAFMNCSALKKINIPTSLTTLGNNAFRNDTELSSSIVLPATLTTIGSEVFRNCSKLSNVTISEGITSISNYAFKECSALKTIELPTTLSKIGIGSFVSSGLTSINIPEGITDIPASAFSECKLTSIKLPNSLLTISSNAFSSNGSTVNSVDIPESVESIANNAFKGTNVKNFNINNIPNRISIGANTPFNTSDTKIHVFTKMASTFEQAPNWSNYAGLFVDDIDIEHVESITLDNEQLFVLTNSTGKLNATVNPSNARIKDVIYTSSNEDIILISNAQTGDFVAGSIVGTATITCTAADGSGKFAKCEVTVKKAFIPAGSVTLSKSEKDMEVGETFKLTATIAPANTTYKEIIWTSSNEDVATVSNGNVTAVAPGVATITAISKDGAARAKCKVTVRNAYIAHTLQDGDPYTNDEEALVKVLTYSRKFKNTEWQPLYIPFRMSYEDWCENFEVAKLTNIHSYDTNGDGKIDRQEMEWIKVKSGTLKENHPYLIKAKKSDENNDQEIIVNGATIYPAANNSIQCSSTEYTYDFRGVYKTTKGLRSIGGYIMAGGQFGIAASDESKVNSYRFYLQITAKDGQIITTANEAKIIILDEFGNEETTAINEIESSHSDATAVYNVNGIKQTSTKQGLNIVKMADGTTKKIFIK